MEDLADPLSQSPSFVEFDEAELVEAMLAGGIVSEPEIIRARRGAQESGARFDRALIELGLLDDVKLTSLYAERLGFDVLSDIIIEASAEALFDDQKDFLARVEIAPIAYEGGLLKVAFSDPFQPELPQSIAFKFNCEIKAYLAPRAAIKAALERSGLGRASEKLAEQADADAQDLERLRSLASDGPVVQYVADIIRAAVDARASDIHFEALETELAIRFRVDGTLRPHAIAPSSLRAAVPSRLKVMADLNISERRRPQDGRIRIGVHGRNIDLRVSTLPTQFGESIVLRVLDRARLALDWDALGFDTQTAARIERITSSPHGMFLVTGPTGSGKSTTLYTALSKLNTSETKVFTLEDPIEYSISGVNQVQVHPEIDLTFGAALRAVLRQDPDVVMIGEIRDAETAQNAVRAALMGRMVLSTVHTNTALGAVDRLLDLGVPDYLLGSVLRGVAAQRLLRLKCAECASGVDSVPAENCAQCGGSGDVGRKAVVELVEFEGANAEKLGQMIKAQSSAGIVFDGHKTLADQAREMWSAGLIDERELFAQVGTG